MLKVSVCRDLEKCRGLWERLWPKECIFDLWAVRYCFAHNYDHLPEFYIAEENGNVIGMLPLNWIEETGRYSFFPGELWQGKTWLEQNKIISSDPSAAKALLKCVQKPMQLRYLSPGYLPGIIRGDKGVSYAIDETGYLFFPARYHYSFDLYMNTFSTRSRKKIAREQESIKARGIRYRFDHFQDIEKLFQMNISVFKENSYFYDRRFLNSFLAMAEWLKIHGMLHITTLLICEEVAAVDMGALWNSNYTVLAGGTNPEFPGAAKVINFQHIEWACHERLDLVDFLCGDFYWKSRFHLQPCPLYIIDTSVKTTVKEKAL